MPALRVHGMREQGKHTFAHLCGEKKDSYYFVCICLKGFQDENVITLKHALDAEINIHKCSGSG